MSDSERETDLAVKFGELVRRRRVSAGMRQEDLAMATGVGRRFIIDLEAGKSSCQLGKSLMVAEALSLDLLNISEADVLPDLPEMEDEDEPSPSIF